MSPQVIKIHNIPAEDASKIGRVLANGNFPEAFGAVTDQMVEAFSIYGAPGDCVEKIRTLMKIGVAQLVVDSLIRPKKERSIDLIARETIPNFE